MSFSVEEERIAAWLEGSLDEAEERALESWLSDEPDAMVRFVEATARDEMLRDAMNELVVEERVADKIERSVRPRPAVSYIAMAAAVVICGLMLFLIGPKESIAVEVLSSTSPQIKTGSRNLPRELSLDSGEVILALSSGVTLELHSPLSMEFDNAMLIRLREGRVNADVGERGKGFSVITEAGKVIDLGTRFGVETDESGESRVAVFSGEVEVLPNNEVGAIRLTEGQAARFSALSGLRRWTHVALAAKEAGISSKPYAGVVSQVKDNLGDEELHPFYGVVEEGMREGALAYTDKPRPSWLPLEGETFPEMLEGADLVRTYHQFRGRDRYRLELQLREAAKVFVLQDVRGEAPDWLAEEFENTGQRVRLGPWNAAVADQPGAIISMEEPYIVASVWEKTVAAGDVELGAPRPQVEGSPPLMMYGIAVKPLESPQE